MEHNGFEYIDLGLSVNWATCNVGASNPWEVGLYFQWGDIIGYTLNDMLNNAKKFDYNREDYKFSEGYGFTKYDLNDKKRVLDIEDDAVHVHMGGNWRMPTREECEELIYHCNLTYGKSNGFYGSLLTQIGCETNGLFIPMGGTVADSRLYGKGNYGYCWSSTPSSQYTAAYAMNTSKLSAKFVLPYARTYGFPIRGVFSK